MPRANRFFVPGYVWHITHRCHKKDFLLKFSRDRTNWVQWLYEARKRYGLEVLNYIVTSNHIHLLVYAQGDREIIPRSLQLIAGSTAQNYNQRKKRNGAFWEDRYHATAVDTNTHLLRCMIYIDLNMVRAGVVHHPHEWQHSGYHELVDPPRRYRIIARDRLKQLLSLDERGLVEDYRSWIDTKLQEGTQREEFWSRSIVVGSFDFVESVKKRLGIRTRYKEVQAITHDCDFILKEPVSSYNAHFEAKMLFLKAKNSFIWNVYSDI